MNARKILADLRVVDGAKVLAPRLYQNSAGLEALLREHGEFAERAIKAVLTRGMIDGARGGSVRSWRYFAPVIEQERKAEQLCVECSRTRAPGLPMQPAGPIAVFRKFADRDDATRLEHVECVSQGQFRIWDMTQDSTK